MKFHLKTPYVNEEAYIWYNRYLDGNALCMQLHGTNMYHEPLCRATFNPKDVDAVYKSLGDNAKDIYVCIKTWLENEGVLEELIKHGVIEHPVIEGVQTDVLIPAGFCFGRLMQLTDTAQKEMQEQLTNKKPNSGR